MELRIVLDKSVVYGLKNPEVDSLDRYFFLIVPPILTNEILADLSKEAEEPAITNKIAGHSYRISGNRGITVNYRDILINSMLGKEIPMEGKFFPAGVRLVRSDDGITGEKIETILEDETIARWERRQFSDEEKAWALQFRRQAERPLNPKLYLDNIAKAGLNYIPPKNVDELVQTVDSLLGERKLQHRLFPILAREHRIPFEAQDKATLRWSKEGRPMFKDFAPYAFFCLRASFIWSLGLTNSGLFQPDKNDRKDLEYCYYLPHCEMFASDDRKHKRLVPFLLRPDQSFIEGTKLKEDLKRLSIEWDELSKEERIKTNSERGHAPIEDDNSIVYQLWEKHRGEISKPVDPAILDAMVVDTRLPEDQRVAKPFREFLNDMMAQANAANELSGAEAGEFRQVSEEGKTLFAVRTTKVSKRRLAKMYPQLTEEDLKNMKSE